MGSSTGKLTRLQRELLEAFFEREKDFFLSGGAALAGFYLHHRATDDLDLFTLDADALERGHHVVLDAAERLGCTWSIRQEAPGFRRYVITRGHEGLVVDLVLERVAQTGGPKREFGAIRVDPPREILANKLAALAGRAEIRDLVDVYSLEESGLSVEDALAAVLAKDAGATPATIAWVLSEIVLPDAAELPGDIPPPVLQEYRDRLVRRLRTAGAPPTEPRPGDRDPSEDDDIEED